MSAGKTTVLVIFGGRSPEHDISIVTGLQVLSALDPDAYHAIPLYIAGSGEWYVGDALGKRDFYVPGTEQLKSLVRVSLQPGSAGRPSLLSHPRSIFGRQRAIEFDIALPALHGLFGEDGRVQGALETVGAPYTGMRTLASAVLMDKALTKHLMAKDGLVNDGISVLDHREIVRPSQGLLRTPSELEAQLGDVKFPCCIKPAHLGSSIGVAKVSDWNELSSVLPNIFRYDDLAILEPFVDNLIEYNISVRRVGERFETSAIERPKHSSELLDFKSKYLSGSNKGAGTKIPGQSSEGMLSLTRELNPQLSEDMENKIRGWAVKAFARVGGTGAPRVDFLCNAQTGELWLNEINPCPGSFGYFLWEAAAKPLLFSELLDALIAEGLELSRRNHLPPDPTPADARLFARKA
jgi:D-alanine-D-alanine ligase